MINYVGLLYTASRDIRVAPTALDVLFATVLGLASVDTSEALTSVLTEYQPAWPYWLQTGMIAGIWLVLAGLYATRPKV